MSAGGRQLAVEERRAQRIDRRRQRVRPVEDVDERLVLLEAAGQLVERVEDRRQEEPGQKERRDEVLDVTEDDVRRGDGERKPAGEEQTIPAAIGIESKTVSRVSGSTIASTTISPREHAAKGTSCVATTERATSWRGNRTFLISSA